MLMNCDGTAGQKGGAKSMMKLKTVYRRIAVQVVLIKDAPTRRSNVEGNAGDRSDDNKAIKIAAEVFGGESESVQSQWFAVW